MTRCQAELDDMARIDSLESEIGELKDIRDLLVTALVRATGMREWTVRTGPLDAAIKHAEEVRSLREALQRIADAAPIRSDGAICATILYFSDIARNALHPPS